MSPVLSGLKVHITSVGILHICNLWIFLKKNCNISCQSKFSSSQTFLLLKLTEMTSTQESVKRFSYTQIPGLTSHPSTLTAKKSVKMKISADKIYYNFSQENPKITNI